VTSARHKKEVMIDDKLTSCPRWGIKAMDCKAPSRAVFATPKLLNSAGARNPPGSQ
jgi:hypothetical protein